MKLYFICISLFLGGGLATQYNVNINTTSIRTLDGKFLSVTLDSYQGQSANFFGLNFSYIQPLCKPLQPAYFRIGGTYADNTIFTTNNSAQGVTGNTTNNTVIHFTAAQLDTLYNFATSVGWNLTFDLNLYQMISNGMWSSSNAKTFLDYASSKEYYLNFELGNEPANYHHDRGQFISGAIIAAAYKSLQSLLNSYPIYANSLLFGTSDSASPWWYGANSPANITSDFISNGGASASAANVFAFHHYYKDANGSTLSDFTNATLFDDFVNQINRVKGSLENYSGPLWLSETSSFYNGGVPNVSNSFAAGFIWMDKLGLAALNNINIVARQTLWGGSYALLNGQQQPSPNPDYWLSVLYKRVVGPNVYNITSVSPLDPNLRLYAHSASTFYNYSSNTVVVFGERLTSSSVTLNFPQFSDKTVYLYVLTSPGGDLTSKSTSLNGNTLTWTPGQNIPDFTAQQTTFPVTIPGYSQFFIVLKN